jgi:hypothetical protein
MRGNQTWDRFRFQTHSADDPRPLVFNAGFPWWCSGYDSSDNSAIIIAYLPKSESLFTYWDDAFDVAAEMAPDGPKFSDRFPRPDWYRDDKPEMLNAVEPDQASAVGQEDKTEAL